MTVSRADIKRYRVNLKGERDAIFLYEHLAAVEPNPGASSVYQRLADTEKRHAALWEAKLREAGEPVGPLGPSLRTRAMAWTAKRFGVGAVLPAIAHLEDEGVAQYDIQPEAVAVGMPGDERSHARVFRKLAQASGGAEGSVLARMEGRHRAIGGNALRAGVLGANDGLTSNLSLVMGVAGASLQPGQILVTGLAGLLAGALSMALGEWVSVQSSRELYKRQISIEEEELRVSPEEEKEELALIYQAKGMTEEQARSVAERIIGDKATALDTLAREELGIDPKELGGSAWVAAGTSFALFALGAIIPVAPYFFMEGMAAVVVSVVLSALGLFAIGALITLLTGRSVLYSGLRQMILGLLAAAVTFGIGKLIGESLAG